MDLIDLGERNMVAVLAFTYRGSPVGCRLTRRHLAGKALEEDGEGRAVDVWFMRPSPELSMLSVLLVTGGALGFQMHLRKAALVDTPVVVTHLPE